MSTPGTFPLCHRFGLTFSAYEDRLILTTEWQPRAPIRVLLTRRMVILILQRLLAHLPELSALHKTPRAYWQQALHIAHQKALSERETAPPSSDQKPTPVTDIVPPPSRTENIQLNTSQLSSTPELFLATELTTEQRDGQLLLGLKGLPLPESMLIPSPHQSLLALSLQTQHLHQLLQLFLNKAAEAQWHLPVDLPWTTDTSTAFAAPH